MNSFRFLLTVIWLVSSTAATTTFYLNGTLFCPLGTYSYHLVIFEEDIMYDDVLSNQPRQVAHGNTEYEITGSDDGDGWFNNYYEIVLHIIHSCHSDGEYAKKLIKVDYGSFPIEKNGEHYISKDIQLYNQGTRKQ